MRRSLGLSPTQKVFRELRRRGVELKKLDALELFAHCGFLHTKDYQSRIGSLEAWEFDPDQEAALRRNLPGAAIKITDSFKEIKKTARKYSLIVVDNPDCCRSDNQDRWEHFDILPDVFRVATDSAVLLVNVKPGRGSNGSEKYFLMEANQLERRRKFYGTDHPEYVPLADMIPVYRNLIEANHFELEWCFSLPRTLDHRIHYLVLKIRKRVT